MNIGKVLVRRTLIGLALAAAPTAFASSSFSIHPIFDSSITGDATNGAAIMATINSVIAIYEAALVVPGPTPVTANITFKEDQTISLGESSTFIDIVPYATYCAALQGFGTIGSGTLNCASEPVNGGGNIALKSTDDRALGLGDSTPMDGTVSLKTDITSPGGGSQPLQPVVEHEIDEVLGLGSGLENTTSGTISATNGPFAEDLFRFSAPGTLIFNAEVGASCAGPLGTAFFSVNGGVTNLAGFNNACNGGDWGDWDGALSRVQNASADGTNPPLGVELTALEAVGFQGAVPEPATFGLIGAALVGLALIRRRGGKR